MYEYELRMYEYWARLCVLFVVCVVCSLVCCCSAVLLIWGVFAVVVLRGNFTHHHPTHFASGVRSGGVRMLVFCFCLCFYLRYFFHSRVIGACPATDHGLH